MTAGADSPPQEFDLAMRSKSRNQQTQTRRAASNSECSSPPDHGKLVHRSAGSSPSSSPSLSPRTPHPWQQHLHYPRTPLIDDAEPESPNESETFTSHFTINSPRLSSPQSSPGVLSPMPFLSGRGLSPAASISLESAIHPGTPKVVKGGHYPASKNHSSPGSCMSTPPRVHGARMLEDSPVKASNQHMAISQHTGMVELDTDEYSEMQEELEDLLAALGEETRKVDVLARKLKGCGLSVQAVLQDEGFPPESMDPGHDAPVEAPVCETAWPAFEPTAGIESYAQHTSTELELQRLQDLVRGCCLMWGAARAVCAGAAVLAVGVAVGLAASPWLPLAPLHSPACPVTGTSEWSTPQPQQAPRVWDIPSPHVSSPFSDKSNRVGHASSDKSSLFNEAEVEAEAASATTANYPPPHTASVVNDTTKPWDEEGAHMLQAAMALAKAACQLHAPEARAEPSCPAASECACECDAEQHQQDKHLGSKNVDASADATNDDEGGTWIYFGNAEVDAVREQGGARTASVKPPPAQAPREPERRAPGSMNRGEHSDGSRATGVNRQSSVEQVEQEFQKQREAAAARRKHLLRARDAGVVA